MIKAWLEFLELLHRRHVAFFLLAAFVVAMFTLYGL